jgi:hypothetical protein
MAIEGDSETDNDYFCSIRPADSDRITREYSPDVSDMATLSHRPQQVRYCYTCWRPGHFSANCSLIPKHERELIAKRRAEILKNRPRQENHTRGSGSSGVSALGSRADGPQIPVPPNVSRVKVVEPQPVPENCSLQEVQT